MKNSLFLLFTASSELWMNYALNFTVIWISLPFKPAPPCAPLMCLSCPWARPWAWCKRSNPLNPASGYLFSLHSLDQLAPSSLLSDLDPALPIPLSYPTAFWDFVVFASLTSLSGLVYQFSFALCTKISTDYSHTHFWPPGLHLVLYKLCYNTAIMFTLKTVTLKILVRWLRFEDSIPSSLRFVSLNSVLLNQAWILTDTGAFFRESPLQRYMHGCMYTHMYITLIYICVYK